MATANSRHPSSMAAADRERPTPAAPPGKNRLMRTISVGNRPLQGMKALVRMATSRSRGLSMMRQPVTPQALHPSPMHMVRL